jgi:hypothetical protein
MLFEIPCLFGLVTYQLREGIHSSVKAMVQRETRSKTSCDPGGEEIRKRKQDMMFETYS